MTPKSWSSVHLSPEPQASPSKCPLLRPWPAVSQKSQLSELIVPCLQLLTLTPSPAQSSSSSWIPFPHIQHPLPSSHPHRNLRAILNAPSILIPYRNQPISLTSLCIFLKSVPSQWLLKLLLSGPHHFSSYYYSNPPTVVSLPPSLSLTNPSSLLQRRAISLKCNFHPNTLSSKIL